MAQIRFLATDDDLGAVWEMILTELRMTAHPDPWFGALPAPALKSHADISAHLAGYPRVARALGYFLTSPEWSTEPLEYQLCENNPHFSPYWFVTPRYGGPSIQFIPRFGYPWREVPQQIVSGMFSDYPHYFSAIDHRMVIKRPDGLAATMKTIKRRLLSLGKMLQAPSGERAIAMGNALAAYDAGVVLRTGDIIYTPVATQRRTKGRT